MRRDEISLLEEELIQLTIKSSLVVLSDNLTLICTVWTRKSYNPESFHAQLKSIWKTRKKFDIQVVGKILFLISFENEDDLEMILEGRPWIFPRQLVIFDRLANPIEWSKIRLVLSLYWIKIRSCPPKCDKKDLIHAIRSTFGGVIKLEVKGDFSWLSVQLDCGRMDHGFKECDRIPTGARDKPEDELPYSLALKVGSNLLGKECLEFGASTKKSMMQYLYVGDVDKVDRTEGMVSIDVTSSWVTVENRKTEVRGGSVKVSIDIEATNIGHNFRDFRDHRIPPIKDVDLGPMDHDGFDSPNEGKSQKPKKSK
ncbi:hypothetical protein CXB51_010168 [Gossypium anomalum]|uniref:DUF4283 domain-containing protein n=1 Tax=Gossypium anomalum TaxID=47600 RepID=A0A8J5Z2E2_9ROSI|nr:hypothetical protein CXB51_010168 [Gossypium anomalum]